MSHLFELLDINPNEVDYIETNEGEDIKVCKKRLPPPTHDDKGVEGSLISIKNQID
jgi:hypothetical protein